MVPRVAVHKKPRYDHQLRRRSRFALREPNPDQSGRPRCVAVSKCYKQWNRARCQDPGAAEAAVCFGCLMLTPRSLRTLATRPFPMDYLDVSDCSLVASDGFMSIAAGPSLRGLSTLRLIRVSITDRTLSIMARTLTRLTFLDISQCRKIRKHGIAALATHLTALRVLVMRFATGLKGGTLRHIACMPRLETVSLKACRKITSGGPRFLARGDFQPRFFELDVSYRGIVDAGVR